MASVGAAEPLLEHAAQRRVVGLGEVEHAQVRGDGLAPEVVGGAQTLLAAVAQIGREGAGVAGGEIRGAVTGPLLVDGHARTLFGPGAVRATDR